MDLANMTPSEMKRIVDKHTELSEREDDEEKLCSIWTAISISLAFIAFFVLGSIIVVSELVRALN